MQQNQPFYKEKWFQDVLARWWGGLEKDRGGRAALRRAKNLDAVFACASFHQHLLAPLREAGWEPTERQVDALAAVAGILAHVEENVPKGSFAEVMARPSREGSKAVVSDLRFRRLLAVEGPEELLSALVRMVRLAGGKANILELAGAVLSWGDARRKSWALDYYRLAPSEKN